MKTITTAVASTLILTLAIAGFAMSDSAGTGRVEAKNVKWLETGFGPWASPVTGDFSKGKHMTMIKFAAGMKTPVHVHSHDYSGVVVSGRWKTYEPGKPETETLLGPGGTWYVKGNVPHVSECLPGEECIFVISQADAFDYKPLQ